MFNVAQANQKCKKKYMDKFRTIVSEISPSLGYPVLQFLNFKVQKKGRGKIFV